MGDDDIAPPEGGSLDASYLFINSLNLNKKIRKNDEDSIISNMIVTMIYRTFKNTIREKNYDENKK